MVRYQGALRSIPLAAGALGICGVLVNRVVSGVRECCVSTVALRYATHLALLAWGFSSVAAAYVACTLHLRVSLRCYTTR